MNSSFHDPMEAQVVDALRETIDAKNIAIGALQGTVQSKDELLAKVATAEKDLHLKLHSLAQEKDTNERNLCLQIHALAQEKEAAEHEHRRQLGALAEKMAAAEREHHRHIDALTRERDLAFGARDTSKQDLLLQIDALIKEKEVLQQHNDSLMSAQLIQLDMLMDLNTRPSKMYSLDLKKHLDPKTNGHSWTSGPLEYKDSHGGRTKWELNLFPFSGGEAYLKLYSLNQGVVCIGIKFQLLGNCYDMPASSIGPGMCGPEVVKIMSTPDFLQRTRGLQTLKMIVDITICGA